MCKYMTREDHSDWEEVTTKAEELLDAIIEEQAKTAVSILNNAFEEEIDTNEKGGMQSKLDTRYDIIPVEVLRDLAEIFANGARKYAKDNWKLIDADSHYNHAMTHYIKDKLGEEGEENHKKHCLCRWVMWYYQRTYGDI